MIEENILAVLPSQNRMKTDELQLKCGQRRGAPVSDKEFKQALRALEAQGSIAVSIGGVKRREPDFPELRLYSALNSVLRHEDVLSQLKTLPNSFVFHETAHGGVQGLGQFTRPDFTMASIRQQRYDPSKHLDVTTFEVKNLAGTNLMAVHETLAHTRFSHYSFLVCPRSKLRPEETTKIANACAEHAVGLILFDLAPSHSEPKIENVKVVLRPVRRVPDPDRVDDFIDGCFPEDKRTKLLDIAGMK